MVTPTPRTPLAWLLIPLVAGYVLAPDLPAMPKVLAALGMSLSCAAILAAWTTFRPTTFLWSALALAGATLLAAGYLQHRTQPPPGWEALPPREAEFTLRIDRFFGSPEERLHGFAKVTETDPHLSDLIGQKLYFSLLSSENVSAHRWTTGDRIRTVGILEFITPDSVEENSFPHFLLRSGAHFQYRRAALQEEPLAGRGFLAFCSRQRDRLEGYLRRGSTEKSIATVNVYVAMLLGKREELSEGQRTVFLQSGTLHLFAISGLHIGVIAFALHSLLTLCRIPARPAAGIGLTLLLCFVGITGAAPSAVRAFLMVLFFWGARFFGRSPNPIAALANSALFVLLLYPHQLWSPGFQLSYSVVAGILFLGLPLGRRLQEKWTLFSGLPRDSLHPFKRILADLGHQTTMMLAVSLSATLLSSPLSIHYFGLFTPGAILLNLIMIPAAGLVIVAGFVSVFLNLLGLGILGIVFNHAAWLILLIMERVVSVGPGVPGLFWAAAFHHPWHGPAILSTLLGALLVCAYRKWSMPFFHFTTPFLLFVLGLLFAARLTFLTD